IWRPRAARRPDAPDTRARPAARRPVGARGARRGEGGGERRGARAAVGRGRRRAVLRLPALPRRGVDPAPGPALAARAAPAGARLRRARVPRAAPRRLRRAARGRAARCRAPRARRSAKRRAGGDPRRARRPRARGHLRPGRLPAPRPAAQARPRDAVRRSRGPLPVPRPRGGRGAGHRAGTRARRRRQARAAPRVRRRPAFGRVAPAQARVRPAARPLAAGGRPPRGPAAGSADDRAPARRQRRPAHVARRPPCRPRGHRPRALAVRRVRDLPARARGVGVPRVMRVLTRPNVGGPARQMAALWHACAARGWQTLLVVGVCDGEPEFDLQAAGVPRLAPDAVDLDSAGFVVVPSLRRGVRPWSDVLAEWRIGKLIEAFVPDVVHTHTSKAGALGRRAARDGDVPVVAHTFHGHVLRDYFGLWPSAVVRVAAWWLARRTDLLFAVSPSCRAELAAMRVAPAARIEVLPPAVDVRAFTGGPAVRARARARLGLQEGQFVLGFVGRLVPIKRPEAFAAVVARIADSVGLVFGDGPLRTEVEG